MEKCNGEMKCGICDKKILDGHLFHKKKQKEEMYPCADCGRPRTKAEGGTTFTVCDVCWDKAYSKKPEPEPTYTIKKLEWKEKEKNKWYEAKSPCGIIEVFYDDYIEKYRWKCNCHKSESIADMRKRICDTLTEAKAAAESHYEETIKGCLEESS